ncbi:MAG: META domain-containing protein [Robiginitomaculum sp.]|nr:META domain-containing protein [Robiginitomaculum sp.]
MTFSFSEGAVIGRGPCKGFKTHVATEGGVFQLGPLKLRGSVCAKDVMTEEGEYLLILARLSHYEIEADGTLVLSSYGAAKIRAVRAA